MNESHQTAAKPWRWTVAAPLRLATATQPRWLLVREGRVWLTRSQQQGGAGVDRSEDVWLAAGERHALPAGSEWVVEGWPAAQLELLQPPPPVNGRGARWSAWLASLVPSFSRRPPAGGAVACA